MSKIKIKITNNLMGLLFLLLILIFLYIVGIENFKGDFEIETSNDSTTEIEMEK